MLLQPPPPGKMAAEEAAARPRAAATESDTWVLLGGLDAALYQAGVVGVWLEALPAPHAIFAGGMSMFNALLALSHDPLVFRTGWERLRAAHVLATSAVKGSALARFGNGHDESVDIARSFARDILRESETPLYVLVGGGFVEAAADGERSAAPLIEESLRLAPSAGALAAAIDTASTRGAKRILVPGIEERRIGERDVARAIEDARTRAIEVVFLPLSTGQRPGVVGYLLPGLGRADRLCRDGRRAALRWLEGADLYGTADEFVA